MSVKKLLLLIYAVCAVLLSGCESKSETSESEAPIASQSTPMSSPTASATEIAAAVIGDDLPISRALAAKMAVLAFNDINSIEAMDREISYADCDEAKWYDKYANAAAILGYIPMDGPNFRPFESLSVMEAQYIINTLNPNNPVKMKITDENRNMPISYALWIQLYEKCLTDIVTRSFEVDFNINEKNIVILADNSNNSKLPEGNIIADSGLYTAYGLDFSGYVDKEVKVLEKDGEILAVLSVESTNPSISGAYVVGMSEGSITVFIGGAERTYGLSTQLDMSPGSIINFTIVNGIAKEITAFPEGFNYTVKLHDESHIEFAEKGSISLSENFRVYSEEGELVSWKKPRNIIVGSNSVRFYENDGEIIAAVVESRPSPETIRVAIKDTDFGSFFHERVEITGTGGFKVTSSGEEKTFSSGDKYVIEDLSALSDRVYIEPLSGRLIIESIKRSQGIPVYRGKLEVSANPNGFLIVNELGIEEYLYSVVPSEMPVSYGIEALKVQAVTARSYACNQFYANNFHQYGANVCDSVISQVYNNVVETESSIKAVDETRGLCLKYNSSVISANFFSTSAGVTANNGEVWADSVTKKFPAQTNPYLSGKNQYSGTDYGDLSIEENMAKFIKSQDIKSYDSFSNWFRWYVEMTGEEIAASINSNLKARYEAAPRLIKTLQPDGIFRSRPVDGIGELVNIEVVKRGQAGNIMTMKITGTKNTILVSTEYNIRTLIRPTQYLEGKEAIALTLIDGKTRNDYSLMPSAFFAMERMTGGEGNILYVKFYGGGNGHGVGMSQTGVKGMVDMGKGFDEILSHFYEGSVVEKMW